MSRTASSRALPKRGAGLVAAFVVMMVGVGAKLEPPLRDTAPARTYDVALTDGAVTPQNDLLGTGGRLVFSTAAGHSRQAVTLVVHNGASVDQRLTRITTGDDAFPVRAPQEAVLTPGSSARVTVSFQPRHTGVTTSALSAVVNGETVTLATLGGLGARDFEGQYEPNLQQILDTLGFRVDVAMPAQPPSDIAVASGDRGNAISTSTGAVGDEILAPYFTAANQQLPVSLIPLAAYVSRSGDALGPFGFYSPTESKVPRRLFSLASTGKTGFGGQNQQLLPGIGTGDFAAVQAASDTRPAISTMTGSTTFGIWDGSQNLFSDDAANAGHTHNMRVYPAVTSDGMAVPDSFIVAIDSGNTQYRNYDYQDFVFLLRNVRATNPH